MGGGNAAGGGPNFGWAGGIGWVRYYTFVVLQICNTGTPSEIGFLFLIKCIR